jgi:bla regulator protein blaR1
MIFESTSAIWTAIADHVWQSTLFAAAAAMLSLSLRKNQARVRYRVWLAASLKFLIPFSLLTSLGQHLATLPGSPGTQAGFSFVMQRVSQPFQQTPHLRTPLFAFLAVLWLGGFVTTAVLCWLRWQRVAVVKRNAIPVSQGREVYALRHLERLGRIRRPITFLLSPDRREPGILGIVRPVLLWPAEISGRLQDAHLKAILAHEVQHVRRRDNLTATLHMIVEAIFWFHPLVWWLGARLVEERERACDEEVLELGSSPQIYAESILKTCAFCVGSRLACVSGVTGGDLKKRIVRIMTLRSAAKLSYPRKLLLAAIGIAAVAGPIVVGLIKAPQASAQPPQTNAGSQPDTTDGPPQTTGTFHGNLLYHVGGGVAAPKLIFAPDPEFSAEALRAHYQGVCVVSLIIDPQGKPQRIQVVQHLGMGLDKKAIEAVGKYKFSPAMLHGKPVAVEVHVEINFRRD